MIAVIVAGTDETCSLAVADVDHHRQAAEIAEFIGRCAEPLAWELAAMIARDRGLPIAGPNGVVDMTALILDDNERAAQSMTVSPSPQRSTCTAISGSTR